MIKLSNLNKYYNKKAANEIHVINDVTLELPDKGLIAIHGKSGSGKTTLLNAIGGLDKADGGTIDINGEVFEKYKSAQWDALRNRDVGYVFQNYNLIDDKSVFENLDIALKLAGVTDKNEREERIIHTLALLGIEKYKKRRPTSLSGGQQQRVAIARALCKHPKIIIADEPTGNLDDRNTVAVMDILKQISRMCLVLLVTHEQKIVDYYADEAIMIVDGKIAGREKLGGEGNLGIQDNAVIYLKDLEKMPVASDVLSLEYYTDDGQYGDLAIKVVKQNDKYFVKLDSEAKLKISIVDSDSEVILKDEHYTARTKEDAVEMMDFSIIKPVPYSGKKITLIKGRDAYLDGLKRVFRKDKKMRRRLQKNIGIFTYFLMAAGIVLTAALFNGVYILSPDQYVKYDASYYQIFAAEDFFSDEAAAAKAAEYAALTEKEGVYDVIVSNLRIQLSYPAYMQHLTADFVYSINDGWAYSHSPSYDFAYYPVEKLPDKDIIAGRNTQSDDEVVLDRKLFDYAFEDAWLRSGQMGYDTPEKAIGSRIVIQGTDKALAVVGIADHGSPSICITEKAYYNVLFNDVVNQNFQAANLFYDATNYNNDEYPELAQKDVAALDAVKQKLDGLTALKETDFDAYKRAITTERITYYLRNGYQNNSDYYDDLNENQEEVKKQMFRILIISDSDAVKKSLSGYDVHSANGYCKAQVKKENMKISKLLTIFTLIILIIAVINLYFMQRSSLFERIKEIGILRNIGASKASIVKIYFFEILALITCSSFLGYIFASAVCYYGNKISFIYYDFWAAILSLAVIVGLHLLFGLLPVWSLLRKTPTEITAKYDI